MTPILTIIMPVYNHEQYLLKALKSIEEQNIKYPYEVVVGEDCSTDSSKEMLQEYQKEAPENYSFVYRQSNLGMLGNISDLFYRAKGKYVTVLEADDYWVYNNKINEQIAFLEAHTEYSGHAHCVMMVDKKGNVLDKKYDAEKGAGIYKIDDFLQLKLPGQTASFMYRNYFTESKCFEYLGNNRIYALDRFIAFVVATKGDIYCVPQKWSAYRHITCEGDSFSANLDYKSREFALSALRFHKSIYEYALAEKCNKSCVKVGEKLYYKSYLRDWLSNKNKKIGDLFSAVRRAKYPITTFGWIFVQMIKMTRSKEA